MTTHKNMISASDDVRLSEAVIEDVYSDSL